MAAEWVELEFHLDGVEEAVKHYEQHVSDGTLIAYALGIIYRCTSQIAVPEGPARGQNR